MATEKRLIDANALLERMNVVTADDTCPLHIAAEIDQEIALSPTVDAVEVVRCKDCKHWEKETGSCTEHPTYYDHGMAWYIYDEDDFCSQGERRTEDG